MPFAFLLIACPYHHYHHLHFCFIDGNVMGFENVAPSGRD